ncbi:hypothetical protein A2U01_0099175, partial [Trifolium medium]|nr:hypothetical protein [Trifolium medium]
EVTELPPGTMKAEYVKSAYEVWMVKSEYEEWWMVKSECEASSTMKLEFAVNP